MGGCVMGLSILHDSMRKDREKDKISVSHKCVGISYLSFYVHWVTTWTEKRRPPFTSHGLLILYRLTIECRMGSMSTKISPSSDCTNSLCIRDSEGQTVTPCSAPGNSAAYQISSSYGIGIYDK